MSDDNVISYEEGRLRRSLPLVISRCMSFSAMTRFDDSLVAAVRDFYGLDLDVVTAENEILDDEDERIRFFPWFLWDWRAQGREPTIGEAYLTHGGHEAPDRDVLRALCASRVGFYEALEDAGSEGARVRDLSTGEVIHIDEDGLEGELAAGELLQCRLVTLRVGGRPWTTINAVYAVLPGECRASVLETLDSFGDEELDPVERCKLHTPELLDYTDRLLERLAAPPAIHHADGEPMLLGQSWLVRADAATVLDILSQSPPPTGFRAEGRGLWRFTAHGSDRGLVDGRDPKRVRLVASSESRLEALEAAVTRVAGVEPPRLRSLEAFEGALMRWAEQGGGDDWIALDPDIPRAARRWFRSWARQWLNTPVRVLGYRTPREAVREAEGRRRIKSMLERFERLQLGRPEPDEALGLDALRRELGLA